MTATRRNLVRALSLSVFVLLCVSPEAKASERVDWRWRRFQAWEYAASAGALAGAFYLRFGVASQDGDWRGGILLDEWVQERVALDNVQTRRTMVSITDTFYLGLVGYRIVDSVLVPGVVWGNWDTALQVSLIDIEAFSCVALTLWGQQALFGRERPYVGRCPGYSEESCSESSEERNRSFFAGHPAVAMTAATLTCTHHRHLPLYGGGAADDLACGLTLGAAALTGYGRAVTEMHYVSDVVIGLGIGAFAGWALPELLHYGHEVRDRRAEAREPALSVRATALPMVGPDRAGMGVAGSF
jgi:membrane-associated phospholipid phosphatase